MRTFDFFDKMGNCFASALQVPMIGGGEFTYYLNDRYMVDIHHFRRYEYDTFLVYITIGSVTKCYETRNIVRLYLCDSMTAISIPPASNYQVSRTGVSQRHYEYVPKHLHFSRWIHRLRRDANACNPFNVTECPICMEKMHSENLFLYHCGHVSHSSHAKSGERSV